MMDPFVPLAEAIGQELSVAGRLAVLAQCLSLLALATLTWRRHVAVWLRRDRSRGTVVALLEDGTTTPPSPDPAGAGEGDQVPPDGAAPTSADEGRATRSAEETARLIEDRMRRGRHRAAGHLGAVRYASRGLEWTGLLATALLLGLELGATDPLVKSALRSLKERDGIDVTYQDVSGGVLQGRLRLRGVQIQRTGHHASNFNLQVSDLIITYSLWDLWRERLTDLHVVQVTGDFETLREADAPPVTPADPTLGDGPRAYHRAGIEIGHLRIDNAQVKYINATQPDEAWDVDLELKSLECAPFRTALAPYDALFRSRVEGTVNGKAFNIRTSELPGETRREWVADQLPVELLRPFLGGPFRWLIGGHCDVLITQSVPRAAGVPVTLTVVLNLRDLQTGVPKDVKPAVAAAARILMTQIRSFPRQKELQIKLELDPSRFDLTRTEDRARLLQQVREALVAAMLQTTGITPDGLTDDSAKRANRTANTITEEALRAIEKIRERRKAKRAQKQKGSPSED